MPVTLSVARSKDGYIDDMSPERLVLSTPEDWAEVYRLRAEADAIVIGAETLRRDNPRLGLKSEELRAQRLEEGRSAEPTKVVISSTGEIDPSLRIFEVSEQSVIIFSTRPRTELKGIATVILAEQITAHVVVTELEKRGLSNIFVEGGAKILDMFLREGAADFVRIATNPSIEVNDIAAPRFETPAMLDYATPLCSNLGGMEIEEYTLREPQSDLDERLLERAIEISRNCPPSQSSYRVGAVIITPDGNIFEGYTHQTSPTHHAEQEAVDKALEAGATLRGATIYSSMEPCSERKSEPESCSQIIIRHHFARAVFALYEPSCFVQCHGALNMRAAGIEVVCIAEFGNRVREINAHLDF
ncbi:MAG: dihydrofolate reductase family protein [Rikenellaceae bacterium]